MLLLGILSHGRLVGVGAFVGIVATLAATTWSVARASERVAAGPTRRRAVAVVLVTAMVGFFGTPFAVMMIRGVNYH